MFYIMESTRLILQHSFPNHEYTWGDFNASRGFSLVCSSRTVNKTLFHSFQHPNVEPPPQSQWLNPSPSSWAVCPSRKELVRTVIAATPLGEGRGRGTFPETMLLFLESAQPPAKPVLPLTAYTTLVIRVPATFSELRSCSNCFPQKLAGKVH